MLVPWEHHLLVLLSKGNQLVNELLFGLRDVHVIEEAFHGVRVDVADL